MASDTYPAVKQDVEPEVEYLSIHALCVSENATPEQVQEFLDLGVDVNAKNDEFGRTPLMLAAAYNKNPEVISVLLEAGADAKAEDQNGRTAFEYAEDNERIKGTPAYWKLK